MREKKTEILVVLSMPSKPESRAYSRPLSPKLSLITGAPAIPHFISLPPGACALVAAVVASGLATDSFTFCGFLPPKQGGAILLHSLP